MNAIRLRQFALRISATMLILLATENSRGADKDDDADSRQPPKQKPASAERAQVTLMPDAINRYGITVGVARKQKFTSHLIVPAQVALNANAMAVVGCPVVGRVAAVRVNAGDTVAKGDELLVVESPELGEAQSDHLQKRTAARVAEAAVEPARSSYQRAKSLYDTSQGIALTEVQKRMVDLNTVENALLTARASMKASETRLQLLGMNDATIEKLAQSGQIDPRYSVRAPLGGSIMERLVTLGELVKPDREKLLVVADMRTLWVLADVPDSRLAELKPGAKASISMGEHTFDGAVSNIGLTVEPSTRTVSVRIEVKADAALKPGMFAQVDITSSLGDEPVVAVPTSAIQSVDGSTAVFLPVTGAPNTFASRMVSVGDTSGGMVSIVSGLEAGEKIVTSGAFILKAELGKESLKDND